MLISQTSQRQNLSIYKSQVTRMPERLEQPVALTLTVALIVPFLPPHWGQGRQANLWHPFPLADPAPISPNRGGLARPHWCMSSCIGPLIDTIKYLPNHTARGTVGFQGLHTYLLGG